MKRVLALALLVLLSSSVASKGRKEKVDKLAPEALAELYRVRDFFELRERVGDSQQLPPDASAELRFYAAAVAHAFNRPQDSTRSLLALDAGEGLSPQLRGEARRLRMGNHLRLHEYGHALAVAREIVAAPADEHPGRVVTEVRNTAVLLAALEGVPPQRLEVRKASRLNLGLERRVQLEIGGAKLRFALDTGANFSVIMRSEAERIGLAIRQVGLLVATSTGRTVKADLAVAGSVKMGSAEFENVVFLVFPDQLLTFPDGTRIPGLVGLPMLEALGEVRFRQDNVMEILSKVPKRKRSNLALFDLEPLVRARWLGQDLVCRLDTGSNRTFFYSPFFERFEDRVYKIGDLQEVKVFGVGGQRRLEAFRVPSMFLNVANADLNLRRVDIYRQPLREDVEEVLHCNLGLDALGEFSYYAINFRGMALVLGGAPTAGQFEQGQR
jgi:predicted aspartyl protease